MTTERRKRGTVEPVVAVREEDREAIADALAELLIEALDERTTNDGGA